MRVALVGLVGEGRPQISAKVSLLTPLSHQESVGASPVALERNHQPCSLMRRRSRRGSRGRKRVTPTMTRVFPSLSFASGWTIKDPVDMLTC